MNPLPTPLTLPLLDLRSETVHPYSCRKGYETKLFGKNRQLLISSKEVVILKGSTISRTLTFDEEIVDATYTSFNTSYKSGAPFGSRAKFNTTSPASNAGSEALVVCLRKSAHIYYGDGRTYVVSFPFLLKQMFPFESGLILEKEQNQSSSKVNNVHPQQLNSAKFLTLVDPIGDFRIVTTSSTSIIAHHEELMTFPYKGLNKVSSLCATYNKHEGSVIIYHIRASLRNSKRMASGNNKYSKRKHSLIFTPNPSRVLEDDSLMDVSGQHVLSLNMEKKRTSTLLSDVSALARMGADGIESKKKQHTSNDFPVLRKDMILTKVDTFPMKDKHSKLEKNLSIYGLTYAEQEAIVIMSKSKREARVYIFQHPCTNRYQSSYVFECDSCIPLCHPKFDGFLITLQNNKQILLVNPFLDVVSPKIDLSRAFFVKELLSSCDDRLAVLTNTDEIHITRLTMEPVSNFVSSCLNCFKYLSGSKINETIWMLWRTSLMLDFNKNEWNAFVIALLSLVFPFGESIDCVSNEITKLLPQAKHLHESAKFNYSISDLIPYITLSLHLLREEHKLDVTAKSNIDKLGLLLTQITTWMGWSDSWTKYYMIDPASIDQTVRFLLVLILEYPPNLFASLTSLFSDNIISYLSFSQLVEESDSVDAFITPRTHCVLKLFELLVSPNFGPNDVIDLMCEFGITQGDLETYPPGIYIPLKEAILICQENPAFEWTNKALELVGRKDLNMLLANDHNIPVSTTTTMPVRSIRQVLSNVLDKSEGISPWDGQSEADRIGITKLIFDYDRRYYEITTILHQTKIQTASLVTKEGLSEYDLVVLQRALASFVALRTLTIPLGRAALFYAGRKPLLTEKFPIPKFNLNTLIAPTMTNIILSDGAIPSHISEWGFFHNGVSSGLSISKMAKGISGSWIIFNKPPELNTQHAGFLLGLGLNGHLKKLEEWHIYNYLGPKHPLTSVGLLIGMAASIKGSMDNKLTKVLSVHAVALLPQGANDLNVPIMVQTAGLIGIGLLYLESQHRRMSEILLSQITSSVFQNDTEQIHEGYRLAAGIALGYVNLGKGDDLRGLNDTHVVDKLLLLAISMKDFQPVQELDKSCCGAILALGFIYMRTENLSIASKLRVPQLEQLLDYVRPDLLLLRCLAKNLIMWSSIGNSIEWVESEIPTTLLEKYSNCHHENLDSDQLGFFNILGGSCLAIAARYASTHDVTARDTLLHFLDILMLVAVKSHSNYDEKIAYHCANNIQNLLALCLSVVMAGSGDLETFRRLRVLHNDTGKEMGYGNYMAINTALGFLFLGGGQYAFDTSNFAVASLVISLYPIFPNEQSEYEVHLQALRHFWALSVEPRCLVIRDVNTQEPCKIPFLIRLKDGNVKEMLSPCLLPRLDEIAAIETMSSDYFNVKVDFRLNSQYLEMFKKSLTIFVYKRKNYQLLKTSIGSLLSSENKSLQVNNGEITLSDDLRRLLELDIMTPIDHYQKKIVLFESSENEDSHAHTSGLSIFNIIDNKLELHRMASNPTTTEDLWNLRLLFAFTDKMLEDLHFVSLEFIENLKQLISNLSLQN